VSGFSRTLAHVAGPAGASNPSDTEWTHSALERRRDGRALPRSYEHTSFFVRSSCPFLLRDLRGFVAFVLIFVASWLHFRVHHGGIG
jgi:hypothetical protein